LTKTQELIGRTALVTGGSSDIGAAIVLALARRGANVVIHCHNNREQAQKLSDQVRSLGGESEVMQADLTNAEEVERLATQVKARGSTDILINNAGTPIRRVHWMDLEDKFIDEVFALNFRAPFRFIQQLTPEMIQRRKGVIVNILSGAAFTGGTETAIAYGAAKGALLTSTRGLAQSLAPQGVRVVAISVGTIDTNFHRVHTSPELLAEHLKHIPVGRMGRPEEIGEVAAFLATDAASFIIGEAIQVNGGAYMM